MPTNPDNPVADLPCAGSPIYLLARGEVSEAKPPGLPDKRNGLPCHYYWRQVAQDGQWVNPEKDFTITITPDLRQQWETAFLSREKDGDETPIVADHKETAASTLGYVKGVKQDGDWYWELHQYLGDTARDTALKNLTSAGVRTNYQSPTGKKYPSAIQHTGITPRPTVPGQGDAVLMLLSRVEDDTTNAARSKESATGSEPNPQPDSDSKENPMPELSIACSAADLDAMHKQIPGLKDVPDAQKASHVVKHLASIQATAQKLGGGDAGDTMKLLSRAEERITAAEAKVTAAEAKATASDAKVLELSRVKDDGPKLPDTRTLMLLGRAADSEWAGVVAAGAATEPVVKEIKALFRNQTGQLTLLSLSPTTANEDPLEMQLAAILRKNKPVEMGQRSGLQTLSRVNPNDDEGDPNKKKDEPLPYVEMAASHNGK